VRPRWLRTPAAGLRVLAEADRDGVFCVWRIAGRKQLTLRSRGLLLEATYLSHVLSATLDAQLQGGGGMSLAITLDDGVRLRLSAYEMQADMLRGVRPSARARETTRAGLMHLRALQALDGQHAGASHRDIAEALFGEDAVRMRWSADGELRAQVRHLLSRGRDFMQGGYLGLAGVNP